MSNSYPSSLQVKSKWGNYKVIQSNIDDLELRDNIVLVDDNKFIQDRIKKFSSNNLVFINSSEENKTLDYCSKLLVELASRGCRKDSTLIAIGGGVVQDLATLVSSLYMRGIKWNFIPTTLMASMDSCIGGKSSINLNSFKNLIGNFYPPESIFIDSTFAKTLSSVDIASGIAEGMKICFAKGQSEFQIFKESIHEWRNSGNISLLDSATMVSLTAKKWFVEVDEFDLRERKLLNFGHSFGHALEAASSFEIPHGIGVLLGMKAAIFEAGKEKVCAGLLEFINSELNYSEFSGVRVSISAEKFKTSLARDKKNSKDNQVLILPDAQGKLEIVSRALNSDALDSCWRSQRRALEESSNKIEVL